MSPTHNSSTCSKARSTRIRVPSPSSRSSAATWYASSAARPCCCARATRSGSTGCPCVFAELTSSERPPGRAGFMLSDRSVLGRAVLGLTSPTLFAVVGWQGRGRMWRRLLHWLSTATAVASFPPIGITPSLRRSNPDAPLPPCRASAGPTSFWTTWWRQRSKLLARARSVPKRCRFKGLSSRCLSHCSQYKRAIMSHTPRTKLIQLRLSQMSGGEDPEIR